MAKQLSILLVAAFAAAGCADRSSRELASQAAEEAERGSGPAPITRLAHAPGKPWEVAAEGREAEHTKAIRDWALLGCQAAALPGDAAPRSEVGGAPVRSPAAPLDAAAGALLACGADELWIIAEPGAEARSAGGDTARGDDDTPGSGALLARLPGEKELVPVPLKHTGVEGEVSGYIATVRVVQQFHNPYDRKIEAIYVFPLPHDAGVREFLMVIGERRIRGIIREREEAERIYREARRQGFAASLLTQERPNVFTQRVANIEPGREIDVEITYFHSLAYEDGAYELVFPMVVGPRYNPPGSAGGVGAVPAFNPPGRSGQRTEVLYLRPAERSGHDISVAFEIDAGVEIEEISSPTHTVAIERPGPEKARVALSPLDRIPNRDLVVRFQVAGRTVKAQLLAHREGEGGYFTLMVYPPAALAGLPRRPLEMVFVLDCSGSMAGLPLAKAKAAVERALKRLGPADTFQIIRFSDDASQLGPVPLAATEENVRRGLEHLESLRSSGGTRMLEGIRAALGFPHDPARLRVVSFLTDGYIGNEDEIFAAVWEEIGTARIFSFGVGSSVNRHLLEGLARLGRGAVAYVGLDESAGRAADLFYERASRPALTDVEIDWGGLRVSEVFPKRLPDLFVGRPLLVTGRFAGGGRAAVRIRGRAAGEERVLEVPVDLEAAASEHPGIASIWARRQIAYLSDQALRVSGDELPREILQLALEHSLLSPFTAFVAVDSSRRTEDAEGVSVGVPVPVPVGVRYETTVPE